jgi:hypothetical protein
MDGKHSAWFAHYLDLPAGDCPVAQHTDALIVERMPFPAQIARLEDRELFIWEDRINHSGKARD